MPTPAIKAMPKTRLINFRVTENQFDELSAEAAKEGISLGELIRRAVLGQPVSKGLKKELHTVLKELAELKKLVENLPGGLQVDSEVQKTNSADTAH